MKNILARWWNAQQTHRLVYFYINYYALRRASAYIAFKFIAHFIIEFLKRQKSDTRCGKFATLRRVFHQNPIPAPLIAGEIQFISSGLWLPENSFNFIYFCVTVWVLIGSARVPKCGSCVSSERAAALTQSRTNTTQRGKQPGESNYAAQIECHSNRARSTCFVLGGRETDKKAAGIYFLCASVSIIQAKNKQQCGSICRRKAAMKIWSR